MIYLKTDDEIELLRKANLLVSATLTEIAKVVEPGVTTRQLDTLAEQFIRDHGAEPTFKGFPNPYGGPFPASFAILMFLSFYFFNFCKRRHDIGLAMVNGYRMLKMSCRFAVACDNAPTVFEHR